ncbi:MAG: hypothetical protein R2857_11895 [Vampirovibrionales bacterium]
MAPVIVPNIPVRVNRVETGLEAPSRAVKQGSRKLLPSVAIDY